MIRRCLPVTALIGYISITCTLVDIVFGYAPTRFRQPKVQRAPAKPSFLLLAKKEGSDSKEDEGGYKFGDISRLLAKKATSAIGEATGIEDYKFGDLTKSAISEVTGDEEYKFGDLSRYLDRQAKSTINSITGKEEYVLGDLSRWADARAKQKVANFTGKEKYEVGDVTKTLMRRVLSGDYSLPDVIFAFKIILSLGVGLTPLSTALPMKLLLQMINFSLMEEVGGRSMGFLANTLDGRFKEALTGDAKYQVGDLTKRAILDFIGKAEYSPGDILKTVTAKMEAKENSKGIELGPATTTSATAEEPMMDAGLNAELEEWDRALDISSKNNEKSISEAIDVEFQKAVDDKERKAEPSDDWDTLLEEWDRQIRAPSKKQ